MDVNAHLVQERVDHAACQQEEEHRQREEQCLRPGARTIRHVRFMLRAVRGM